MEGTPKLILQAFGIQTLSTRIFKGIIKPYQPDVSTLPVSASLGTAVFSNLQFKPIVVGGILYTLPPIDTVLFTVTQQKNTVFTPIQGGTGTVKEYIGFGDFQINVKGVITGKNGTRPTDFIQMFNKFMAYNQSLEIISDYLNTEVQYFVPNYDTGSGSFEGVNEIVVTRYENSQDEGSYSYFKFEFDAVSERPVELIING